MIVRQCRIADHDHTGLLDERGNIFGGIGQKVAANKDIIAARAKFDAKGVVIAHSVRFLS